MVNTDDSWKQIQSLFDPSRIAGEDVYCSREHTPLDRLRYHFVPEHPGKALFVGHRGSGKSSMLGLLLQYLRDDYFVVYLDIEHNLDSAKANQVDLLFLLGAALYKVAQEEGLKPDAKNLESLADSIKTLIVRKTSDKEENLDLATLAQGVLGFGGSALGVPFAEKLAKAVIEPFRLSTGFSEQQERKAEIEPQIQKVINNVNLIIGDVSSKAKRPPFIVVDGLDKLPKSEQARQIFLESRALLGPKCHLVYTLPMSIFCAPGYRQLAADCPEFLLPNVRVFDRLTHQPVRSGERILRQVVATRLATLDLTPGQVFTPDALKLLIAKSGGVLRDLIRMVRGSCIEAIILKTTKITLAVAREAVANEAANLGFQLTTTRLRALQEVRRHQLPSGDSEVGDLLQDLLIMAYRNRETWFDVHPLLWEHLERAEPAS